MQRDYLYFWADVFKMYNRGYQPYSRALAYLIMPCHRDWSEYYLPPPANDRTFNGE